jgi:hypothetical protein
VVEADAMACGHSKILWSKKRKNGSNYRQGEYQQTNPSHPSCRTFNAVPHHQIFYRLTIPRFSHV